MSATVFQESERPHPADPLAAKTPAELAAHARPAERLVDEEEPLLADGTHEGAEDAPPLEIVGSVALYRDEGLFFRE
jgi:hypothetical protein